MDSQKAQNLVRLAHVLDSAIQIPGTNFRFGLDPLLGLLGIVGGSGDFIGGALSAYIVIEAAKLGLPPHVVWQMVGNIVVDSCVGFVPGVGDILDFTWRANTRNVALLKEHLNYETVPRKRNPFFVVLIAITLGAIVFGFAILLFMIIRSIFGS
jgi:Domain of unknown function (DUF4112)